MVPAVNNKRNVLIVSYDYPPVNTIGALRIGKFVKYLPEFGWEPIVLTVNENKALSLSLSIEPVDAITVRTPYFSVLSTVTESLADRNEIPNKKCRHVCRNVCRKVIHRLACIISNIPLVRAIPLNGIGWLPYGIRSGKQTIRSKQIDILFSSSNPPVCHIIASRLCKRTKIPWVAEFRDLWSLSHYNKLRGLSSLCQRRIEKLIIHNSRCLVTVSEPLAKDLEELHSKEVLTITNGYDEEDFLGEVSLISKFTITYTGKVYYSWQDPTPLFQALSEMKRERSISVDDVEVRFYGINVDETISRLIQEYSLQDVVKIYGLVPYRESLMRQRESTLLLLLTWNNPVDKGIYTGKVFEYLGAGRPILAIGLNGQVVDELLTKTGSGIVVNKVEEIKDILRNWIYEFKTNGEIKLYYSPKLEVIRQYTRREQAKQLATVFNKHCKS